MKRKISIKPAPELELALEDKVFTIVFSNIGFLQLHNKYGELQDMVGEGANIFEFMSKYMHCYLEFSGEEITLDECKSIVVSAGVDFIEAFTDCMCEYIDTSGDIEMQKKLSALRKQLGK